MDESVAYSTVPPGAVCRARRPHLARWRSVKSASRSVCGMRHYKKPAFWVVAASVAVKSRRGHVLSDEFTLRIPTQMVWSGFHREQSLGADVTDEVRAPIQSVQRICGRTDAVHGLLPEPRNTNARCRASAMEDCYASALFYQQPRANVARSCSEREAAGQPHHRRQDSGSMSRIRSAELRDYLFDVLAQASGRGGPKTMTERRCR